MILKKLFIKNLRSFKEQEIIFKRGSTLLSGDIGSGKTTILLAIEFGLFGLQPGQKGISLLRSQEDQGRVILEFEVGKKEIIIERTLKRKKNSVSQDYTAITVDGEKFEGSISEIKDRVLKLLNYPLEFSKKINLLYKFTIYTPQEEMKQIILEPRDLRFNTLRYVFGIDKYKRIEENTFILISKLKEKIRINEGLIYNLEDWKKSLQEKREELKNLKVMQKDLVEKSKQAMEFRISKEKNLKEALEKIDEKKSLENEESKSRLIISEKEQQKANYNSNIKSLELQLQETIGGSFNNEELVSLKQRIEFQKNKESELQKEYIQIITKINFKKSKIEETESLKSKIFNLEKCPTCLQEVSENYKENILDKANKEIQNLQKEVNEFSMKKNQLDEDILLVKRILQEFQEKKSQLDLLKIKLENSKEKQQRIVELEEQNTFLEKDLNILKGHLQTIEESIKDYQKYDLIYENLKIELNNAKIVERNKIIKEAEINKEIQFSEQQIQEKQKEIEKKELLKEKTERIREIEYWISEKFLDLILFTEKQVMVTLRIEFAKVFSKWFSILVSDSLSTRLDEDFCPIIEQQDYGLDYSFLSGGERTAIALAYRLALNQIINSLLSNIKTKNLVILDEPTDGFSENQLNKMGDVLNQLNVEQLILVSHEQKIEDFVENIIRVNKFQGVSEITEINEIEKTRQFNEWEPLKTKNDA